MDASWLQDVRWTWRGLARHRVLAAFAVLALAVGLGASASLFALFHDAVLHPYPYRKDAGRFLFLWASFPATNTRFSGFWSAEEVRDLRTLREVFEEVVPSRHSNANLTGGERPERVAVTSVAANVFAATGVQPRFGRPFGTQDERGRGERVVVLGDRLWRSRFAARPGVVGSTIELDGEPYEVIGVMPPRFRWLGGDVFVPLGAAGPADRGARVLRVFAVRRQGVPERQVDAALAGLAGVWSRELASAHPEYRDCRLTAWSLRSAVLGDLESAMGVAALALTVLLLLTSANVGHLLLAQAVVRQRETALRAALGATRFRLLRLRLIEGGFLGLTGGLVGFGLARLGLGALLRAIPERFIPESAVIALGLPELAATLGIALLLTLLFSLVPVSGCRRLELGTVLRTLSSRATSPGRAGRRRRDLLVVLEVAMALTLVSIAALSTQSFANLSRRAPGFSPDGLASVRFALPARRYPDGASVLSFDRDLLARVRALPEVSSAGLVLRRPLVDLDFLRREPVAAIAGRQPDTPPVVVNVASPGFFAAAGIPLLRGRPFAENDDDRADPVCVVSAALAATLWPGEEALGRSLILGPEPVGAAPRRVVGVVGDVGQMAVGRTSEPEIYLPYAQATENLRDAALVVRSSGSPGGLLPILRQIVGTVDPLEPVYWPARGEDMMTEAFGTSRLLGVLLSLCGALAVLLAAIGVYAVSSFALTERRRDVGVWMALGAGRRRAPAGAARRLAGVGGLAGSRPASRWKSLRNRGDRSDDARRQHGGGSGDRRGRQLPAGSTGGRERPGAGAARGMKGAAPAQGGSARRFAPPTGPAGRWCRRRSEGEGR